MEVEGDGSNMLMKGQSKSFLISAEMSERNVIKIQKSILSTFYFRFREERLIDCLEIN